MPDAPSSNTSRFIVWNFSAGAATSSSFFAVAVFRVIFDDDDDDGRNPIVVALNVPGRGGLTPAHVAAQRGHVAVRATEAGAHGAGRGEPSQPRDRRDGTGRRGAQRESRRVLPRPRHLRR
mmetsp:Transcript_19721/g.61026  ORF Transcript_19721/g.61026 Transcript_19721/m.61026 type:complete len:121 (+) Transcript_19721:484-846(+)